MTSYLNVKQTSNNVIWGLCYIKMNIYRVFNHSKFKDEDELNSLEEWLYNTIDLLTDESCTLGVHINYKDAVSK